MSETLKDLLEYLQNKIDSGEHKIFYNDLGWDIKTIDCINAINEQQEKIEKLHSIIKEAREYIKSHTNNCMFELRIEEMEELLEILDKVGSDKE